MRLTATQAKWLKTAHLVTVACWAGGALSLILLHQLRFEGVAPGGELHGIDRAAHLIDINIVVIGGALGCLVTGLLYSVCTGWGFIRHRWIIGKWLITLFGILFGTFALGPWEKGMLALSGKLGHAALTNDAYLRYMHMNFGFGLLQVCLLIGAIWLSVFKPWKRPPPAVQPKERP